MFERFAYKCASGPMAMIWSILFTAGGALALIPKTSYVLVFFANHDAELDKRGRAILAEAAFEWKHGASAGFCVYGHAHELGKDLGMNLDLALQRAEAVKLVLLRNGVADSALEVIGVMSNERVFDITSQYVEIHSWDKKSPC